jgi:hypothetical protein
VCTKYGDCCEDFVAACPEIAEAANKPGSCTNNCGGYGGGADGCWCDSVCTSYGDCCSDFSTDCPAIADMSMVAKKSGARPSKILSKAVVDIKARAASKAVKSVRKTTALSKRPIDVKARSSAKATKFNQLPAKKQAAISKAWGAKPAAKAVTAKSVWGVPAKKAITAEKSVWGLPAKKAVATKKNAAWGFSAATKVAQPIKKAAAAKKSAWGISKQTKKTTAPAKRSSVRGARKHRRA